MDSLSAIFNIIAVQLIERVKPSDLLTAAKKDIVDYFMIFVLSICWLRFFTYFLVIRDISKLLLILVAMIGDTLAFMFIVCCFILIMSSIFTTLYQDVNPDKFGGLAASSRALFDATIGSFDYSDMGERELSFSILQIVFVFFGNILLLNYLIAILSTTYENMKQTGIFKYKVNLYQYCERFMIAFEEKAYGEIVLHPPPLSYISMIMMPFVWSSFLMTHVTKWFSYMMHWLENVFFVLGFLFLEILLLPLAYLKVLMNLLTNSLSVLKALLNCAFWMIIGLFVLFFLVLRDVGYLLKILFYHHGCRASRPEEKEEELIPLEERERVYNETRNTVIALYKRLQRHILQDGNLQDEEAEEELLQDAEVFLIEQDENLNEDFLYVVKKSLIIDEWRKRCFLQERKKRIEAKSIFKMSNLKNRLQKAFDNKFQAFANKDKDDLFKNRKNNFDFAKRMGAQKRQKDLQNQLKNVFLEQMKNDNT